MSNRAILGTIVVLALLGLGLFWYSGGFGPTATSTPPGGTTTLVVATSTPLVTATTSNIKLALLDISGTTTGKSRGCDKVVMVDRRIASTTMPLTAAMRELFGLSTTSVSGQFNFIDRTNETLTFDRATVSNGTANIYLTGTLSGLAGVCDDPRAQIQIEETALQFPTVSKVQIFLDGQPTSLTPSQR